VSTGLVTRIDALAVLALEERLDVIGRLDDELWSAFRAGSLPEPSVDALRRALVEVVEADVGTGQQRLPVGVLLGRIGDPRLGVPADPAYWISLTQKTGERFEIGKYEVTNREFRAFVAAGGYDDRALWSEEGWSWRLACPNPWPTLAADSEDDRYTVDNQPVVGVTWFEANAYATWAGARLLKTLERAWAVRGPGKRPYPWGAPFGEGRANSKEEVLQRPCAVGLYVLDRTPEGVCDLAGNVGEWTADAAGDEYLFHPGSWDQPSLACWAKALTTEAPSARWGALGFRLARDVAGA